MMAGIRGMDTKPEMLVRRALHAQGFRYRLHDRRLPGSPDIVLPRYRAVIFVHGCFWHRHEECRFSTTPSTRPEFWQHKFNSNVERDRRNVEALTSKGWRVAIVWECALRSTPTRTISAVSEWLHSDACYETEFGELRSSWLRPLQPENDNADS
jgi:DNA mismatch endonuclease (patch repair protein)